MRLAPASGPWWRLDASVPTEWNWDGFAVARHRFDPPSGRFRVRYGANAVVAAARERFPSQTITEADAGLFVVRMAGSPSALHLTHQRVLDALGVDDRISTGRLDAVQSGEDPLLSVGQRLSDAVFDWWNGVPPPLVYRTRSMPTARSIAFTDAVAWDGLAARPLRQAVGLLVALVTRHGFTVPGHWLT